MGRSQELSEFKCGTVLGCHLCNKSILEFSLLLNIPQSTIKGITTKWKQLGTAAQPQSGRPRKTTVSLTEVTNCLQNEVATLESIAKDLQTCGLQISTTTVCRELHGIVFHG
ncbi:unnamed protein product [Staurois parvus]|uniref:Transposase n=1 Tax=Staurois parvus TaxID=386267 RepID=A0ABN9FXB1_9NEOB|nr:unnamed protein product [Staurois parvus]